ncbi:MAG: hypothetical protein KC417_17490, partial [Myxococcales bacterium]|nr:hypothetical protein [Myxococcales bacterium]
MDSVNDEEFARMELRLRDVARQRAELATEVARRGVLVRDVLVSMGTGRAAVAEAPPEVAPETVEVVPVDDAGIAQAAREHEARVASLEGEVRGLRFRADDAERVVAGLPSLRSQLADADEENRRLGELVASLRRQVAELDARAAEAALRIEEERSDAEA